MRRISILIFLLYYCSFAYCQRVFPKHEVRAVWLTTLNGLDWPQSPYSSAQVQQLELCKILDQLKKANINTVLFQTRIRATTIYPSSFEPFDACMTGRFGGKPDYDPLSFIIDECHKRGMELHAWIVTLPIGKWNSAGCKLFRKRHPQMVMHIGEDGYMNPEKEQTGTYLAKICEEITKKYDIDGIHLDYIRYPENWLGYLNRVKGRQFITSIVRKIYESVKKEKRWIKLSCSPIGKYSDLPRQSSNGWDAYNKVCQDAQDWLKTGLMDELFPMMYFKGEQFFPFAIDWSQSSGERIIAPGLGIYLMSPVEQNWSLDIIKREMNVLRQCHMGHTFFRSHFFTDDIKGIYSYVADHFDPYPALIPAMTWEYGIKPAEPLNLKVSRMVDCTKIEWMKSTDHTGISETLYNLYGSETYPVDINDAKNIIATRLKGFKACIMQNTDLYFAITAMDRFGNESKPLQEVRSNCEHKNSLLEIDGNRLNMPIKDKLLDAEYATIESLTGKIIKIIPYSTSCVDISSIPSGMYVMYSLNKKGVRHRMGFFIIHHQEL